MKKFFRLRAFKDISITKKLYFIVGTMAVLIAVELVILWFAIHTLSSVRALVDGEGLWSKAQKDGIYQLEKYYRTHDDKDYLEFQRFMRVPMGDHKARVELLKENPDLNIARQGFLEGRIHPDDIDGTIKLLRRFHNVYYIQKAVSIWTEGDSLLALLIPIGERMHLEINSSSPSKEKLNELVMEIDPINKQLTTLEDNFSYTLGEGSRWLENLILKLLFIVALTVEITGLFFSITMSKGITRGLNEINRAAIKISKGDLSERATVFSKDEIGQVAIVMNQMTERLILSNKELSQFAYVASHDLQEPLRKIRTFSELMLKNIHNEAEAKKYFDKIKSSAQRMTDLIRDVLNYSRLSDEAQKFEETDLNQILKHVKSDLELLITEKNAIIKNDKLPVIKAISLQIYQLFSNLIVNSLKFTDTPPVILITSKKVSANEIQKLEKLNPVLEYIELTFTDNGIGFEQQYAEQIFVIFRRLNNIPFSGTGIGLALCKKIVENHHGMITAHGELNKGATFHVYLPV